MATTIGYDTSEFQLLIFTSITQEKSQNKRLLSLMVLLIIETLFPQAAHVTIDLHKYLFQAAEYGGPNPAISSNRGHSGSNLSPVISEISPISS